MHSTEEMKMLPSLRPLWRHLAEIKNHHPINTVATLWYPTKTQDITVLCAAGNPNDPWATSKVDREWWSTVSPKRLCQALSLHQTKKPSQINDLLKSFSNTLAALASVKKIWELCSGISPQYYLTTTSQWCQILNMQLHNSTLQLQQYKKLIIEFQEQRHLHYKDIFHEGHSDSCSSRWCKQQFNPLDATHMFEPHYHPKTMIPHPTHFWRFFNSMKLPWPIISPTSPEKWWNPYQMTRRPALWMYLPTNDSNLYTLPICIMMTCPLMSHRMSMVCQMSQGNIYVPTFGKESPSDNTQR